MYQPISRFQHAVVDYIYAPLVALTPFLFGFTSDRNASLLAWVVAGGLLAASLTTRTELGVIRVIPYRVHLIADFFGGFAFLAAPWLFGFASDAPARNVFLVMGLMNITAGLLSRPEEMPVTSPATPASPATP